MAIAHPEPEPKPASIDTGLEVKMEEQGHHPVTLNQKQVHSDHDHITIDQEETPTTTDQVASNEDGDDMDQEEDQTGPTTASSEQGTPTLPARRARLPLGFYAGMLFALTWILTLIGPTHAAIKLSSVRSAHP